MAVEQPSPDPQRPPDETYDPEMTEGDEGNTPPEPEPSEPEAEGEKPVTRPL